MFRDFGQGYTELTPNSYKAWQIRGTVLRAFSLAARRLTCSLSLSLSLSNSVCLILFLPMSLALPLSLSPLSVHLSVCYLRTYLSRCYLTICSSEDKNIAA